jgi:hypothetical protein
MMAMSNLFGRVIKVKTSGLTFTNDNLEIRFTVPFDDIQNRTYHKLRFSIYQTTPSIVSNAVKHARLRQGIAVITVSLRAGKSQAF